MKKLILILTFACSAILAFAQMQVTTAGINLRDEPNASSQVLTIIPRGASVNISGGCAEGWCPVEYRGVSGYVSKAFLRDPQGQTIQTNGADAQSPVHYYTNVDGNKVQAPTKYAATPAGASAQCADGTYSFSQHRRGTCSHHGGVARWL